MNTLWNELSSNKAIRLSAVAAIGLLAVFLLLLSLGELMNFGRPTTPVMNTITVEADGSATAIPDIARITFTVMEQNAEVAVAQQAATDRTKAALEALKQQGIDDKDIKTLSYNVYPQYASVGCMPGMPCPTPRISGYEVSQSVEVKVRETDKASTILGALGSLNVQNISGPEFTVDDPDAVKAEARAEAVEKAREKARELARNLGVRLGKVVSFSENNQPPYMMGYDGMAKGGVMMEAAAQSAPSLPMGENEYTAYVYVTYEIR